MNIQRYILPASIAATLHVALLWFLPREDYVQVITLPLKPVDPPPPKPVNITPPEETDSDPKPVEPLASGSTPPELPDLPVTTRVDVLTVPIEAQPDHPTTDPKVIPTNFGPGEGDLPGPDRWSRTRIFSPEQLDRTPSARAQLPPEYPPALKQEGIAGSVVVEFDVNRTGQVTAARVVRSSRREFEEPTLRAVRKWRFEPGRRNGQAVPFRMQVPVDFRLE